MSDRVMLVGFLSLKLKKCVVPTHDAIATSTILPAVKMLFGEWIALVPAVITNIQGGLRMIVRDFILCQNRTQELNWRYVFSNIVYITLSCSNDSSPFLVALSHLSGVVLNLFCRSFGVFYQT